MTKRLNLPLDKKPESQMKWLAVVPVVLIAYFVFFMYQRDDAPRPLLEDEIVERAIEQPQPVPVAPAEVVTETAPEQTPPPAVDTEQLLKDREYISYAFPVISTWDATAVKPLLSEATAQASSDEQLAQVMTVLEDRLGGLESFELPELLPENEVVPDVTGATDAGELAHYRFMAYYESGPAEVSVVLQREQEASTLHSFNINIPN